MKHISDFTHLIKELYIKEEKSLNGIKVFLLDEHQFITSIEQIKKTLIKNEIKIRKFSQKCSKHERKPGKYAHLKGPFG